VAMAGRTPEAEEGEAVSEMGHARTTSCASCGAALIINDDRTVSVAAEIEADKQAANLGVLMAAAATAIRSSDAESAALREALEMCAYALRNDPIVAPKIAAVLAKAKP